MEWVKHRFLYSPNTIPAGIWHCTNFEFGKQRWTTKNQRQKHDVENSSEIQLLVRILNALVFLSVLEETD